MKKYPKDTPVTLEMLAEIFIEEIFPLTRDKIKSMIEPPKPEPKDGEWWLVETSNGWQCVRYYHMPYFWDEYNPERDDKLGPIPFKECKPIRKVNIDETL